MGAALIGRFYVSFGARRRSRIRQTAPTSLPSLEVSATSEQPARGSPCADGLDRGIRSETRCPTWRIAFAAPIRDRARVFAAAADRNAGRFERHTAKG
jgi:hypothetical protein